MAREAGRDPTLPPNVLRERGERLFNETYGSSAQQTRTLLRGVHPDFGSPRPQHHHQELVK